MQGECREYSVVCVMTCPRMQFFCHGMLYLPFLGRFIWLPSVSIQQQCVTMTCSVMAHPHFSIYWSYIDI